MAKLSKDINTVKKDFNKIDKNEDGGVTDEEIKEFLVGRARAAGLSQKVSEMSSPRKPKEHVLSARVSLVKFGPANQESIGNSVSKYREL